MFNLYEAKHNKLTRGISSEAVVRDERVVERRVRRARAAAGVRRRGGVRQPRAPPRRRHQVPELPHGQPAARLAPQPAQHYTYVYNIHDMCCLKRFARLLFKTDTKYKLHPYFTWNNNKEIEIWFLNLSLV